MQIRKINGIITSIRPHQDLDRVISVFSAEHGRIRVVAKGVRKVPSRRGYHLDVLNHAEMEIEEMGAGTLNGPLYLREIAIKDRFQEVKDAPENFASACLIARFLERILPEQVIQREMLTLTLDSFCALKKPGCESAPILLTYFAKTLSLLGHIPPTLAKDSLRQTVWNALAVLDPQLTLNARRTLGMFASLDSIRSS